MSAKIVQLDIQNVMRIKAVSIAPDGNIVILGGRNAQGKTSVLDAISVAIGGMKLCPDVPIREGEDKAEVSLTLGDLQVTRKFKRTDSGEISSSLSVKNAEGQPLSPPQRTLDALIGRLAFDPLEFSRMAPAAARETLRELVGLDVEQDEEELGRIYRERTEAGVAKRAARAVVDELPVPRDPEPYTNLDAVIDQLGEASERRGDFEKLKAVYHKHYAEQIRLAEAIAEVEANLTRLKKSSESETALLEQADKAIDDFEVPEIEPLQVQLKAGQATNQAVANASREVERYKEKVAQAEEAELRWKDLDVKHNELFHSIKKKTEAVTYPIEDMELRKEGVFYQGVPFEQGSRAEKIKVSLAMGIAMNEKLGILLIRDGSVLDEDSMKIIADLAEAHDFQFWIEMARGYKGAAGAVVIEDGGVVV